MEDDSKWLFNIDFARDRGLEEWELQAMQAIYLYLHKILARPLEMCQTRKDAVQQIEAFETTLQLFWKFDLDTRHHSYWYRVKGCVCPELDNSDPVYFGRRIINGHCKFHGGGV